MAKTKVSFFLPSQQSSQKRHIVNQGRVLCFDWKVNVNCFFMNTFCSPKVLSKCKYMRDLFNKHIYEVMSTNQNGSFNKNLISYILQANKSGAKHIFSSFSVEFFLETLQNYRINELEAIVRLSSLGNFQGFSAKPSKFIGVPRGGGSWGWRMVGGVWVEWWGVRYGVRRK